MTLQPGLKRPVLPLVLLHLHPDVPRPPAQSIAHTEHQPACSMRPEERLEITKVVEHAAPLRPGSSPTPSFAAQETIIFLGGQGGTLKMCRVHGQQDPDGWQTEEDQQGGNLVSLGPEKGK